MSVKYNLNLSKYSTHNIVRRMIGKDNIVLDIGCSSGYMGLISDRSNKFYGLDISNEALKIAKKKYVSTSLYDLNSLRKIPWNIRFDVIVFADVLEHTVFPDQVLSFIIKNYLKKNGKVVISLPNIANWQIRFNLLTGNFNYSSGGIMDKTHLHFYTFRTSKELVESCGLKISEVESGSSMFGSVIAFLPFLRGLLTTSIVLKTERK